MRPGYYLEDLLHFKDKVFEQVKQSYKLNEKEKQKIYQKFDNWFFDSYGVKEVYGDNYTTHLKEVQAIIDAKEKV